jgi:flagellar biogenesis protein FliO
MNEPTETTKMSTTSVRRARAGGSGAFAQVLLLAVATGCSGVFISAVSMYYTFNDIGINAAANSLGLVFFTLPIVFAVFIGVGLWVYRRLARSGFVARRALPRSLGAMALAFVLLFLVDAVRLADYPTFPRGGRRGLVGFFEFMWEEWARYRAQGTGTYGIGQQVSYTLILGIAILVVCTGGYLLMAFVERRAARKAKALNNTGGKRLAAPNPRMQLTVYQAFASARFRFW